MSSRPTALTACCTTARSRSPRSCPAPPSRCAQIVQACFEAEVPWVARGSGTGLSGGALPVAEGVLIVLSRLRRILVGRPRQRPGGGRAGRHQRQRDPRGLPHPLLSAGPVEPDRLLDRRQRRRELRRRALLQVRLHHQLRGRARGGALRRHDGRRCDRDAPGYDLLGAFVGSEGTLGVATKIVLRVIPAPESVSTMLAFFDDTSAAGDAVTAIVDAGIVPGAIEMMDRLSIEAAEQSTGAGYRLDAGRGAHRRARRTRARSAWSASSSSPSCARRPARWMSGSPSPTPSATSSGVRARPRSPRWDGSRPPTTCRTASSRAPACPRCCARSTRWPPTTTYGSPTCSTPATATCIPLVCYDSAVRGRGRPRRGAGRPHHQGLRRRGRLHHRRARRRRRQEGLHAGDVLRARPGGLPAPALRL